MLIAEPLAVGIAFFQVVAYVIRLLPRAQAIAAFAILNSRAVAIVVSVVAVIEPEATPPTSVWVVPLTAVVSTSFGQHIFFVMIISAVALADYLAIYELPACPIFVLEEAIDRVRGIASASWGSAAECINADAHGTGGDCSDHKFSEHFWMCGVSLFFFFDYKSWAEKAAFKWFFILIYSKQTVIPINSLCEMIVCENCLNKIY